MRNCLRPGRFFLIFVLVNCAFQLIAQTSVTAPAIPQITNIIGILEDGPRPGTGIALLNNSNSLNFYTARYRIPDSLYSVEVYASSGLRPDGFGPSNLLFANPPVSRFDLGHIGYKVLKGRPSYLLPRTDSVWFLFVFPDQPLDPLGFMKTFADCFEFFESRAVPRPVSSPGGLPADFPRLFPALVGTIPGR